MNSKMWGFRETRVYLTLNILVFSCTIVLSAPGPPENAHTNALASGTRIFIHQDERLDIKYSNATFKEIEPDVLQVVGKLDNVFLKCESTMKNSTHIYWAYHGINKEEQVGLARKRNWVWLFYSNITSPVARMECFDIDNPSLSNNTLIYIGDGKPPFLHNHGKTVPATVLNDTAVRLPCVLNYPLDNTSQYQLQLLKDGVQVENKNNCLNYTPEHGYSLNLTKLTNPYGTYECRVINSTEDDFVKVELRYDDLIRAKINVKHSSDLTTFHKGEPYNRTFFCKVPKTDFKNKFEWYFLLANGSYTDKLNTEKSNLTATKDPKLYSDSVKIRFSDRLVTHVVCTGFLQGNDTRYNNSYAVEIKEPIEPKITSEPSNEPIIYTPGKNLTCAAVGDPITFTWLKNGKPVSGLNIENTYFTTNKQSTISLNPSADDIDANYTCVVENFLGKANISYRVQLKEPEPGNNNTLVTLGICLSAIAVICLLVFAFYHIKFERRFSDEQIRNFFHGLGSKEVSYTEFGDQEPYENVKYDTTKEINIQSLNFVRDLKGGNFGKVQFGYWINKTTGDSLPVAIKSIKDDPKASDDDIDFAFRNFLKEIKIMQILGEHENVVKYIGAVTSDLKRYSAYLVVEYCCEGDLATYLRDFEKNGGSFHDDVQGLHLSLSNGSGYDDVQGLHSNSSGGSMNGIILKTSHLMIWAEHIAHGMEYISSKNLVHRDIAARNVLLSYQGPHSNHPDPGKLTAKISDFGLSKNLQEFPKDYYPIIITEPNRSRPISLPLRWISVETLQTLKFTSQSDVWAFGVTLWEMFSLGEYPYRQLVDKEDLRASLIYYLTEEGGRLPEPKFVPSEIWDIMEECWQDCPTLRPDFMSLRGRLYAINENRRNLQIQHEPEREVPPPISFAGYSTVDFVENLGYNPSSDLDYDEDIRSTGESEQ